MTERAMLYRYRRIGRMLICCFCIGLLCAGAGCLLLVGNTASYYIFNDSQTGCVTYYEKEKTEKAYTALGCQAVVVTAA